MKVTASVPARRIGSKVPGLPWPVYFSLRKPGPAGHARSGLMTSSAWEGWWHEEHPAAPSPLA